jgi:hypothetical protein
MRRPAHTLPSPRSRALLRALRLRRLSRDSEVAPPVVHMVADLDELDSAALAAAHAWRRRSRLRA